MPRSWVAFNMRYVRAHKTITFFCGAVMLDEWHVPLPKANESSEAWFLAAKISFWARKAMALETLLVSGSKKKTH